MSLKSVRGGLYLKCQTQRLASYARAGFWVSPPGGLGYISQGAVGVFLGSELIDSFPVYAVYACAAARLLVALGMRAGCAFDSCVAACARVCPRAALQACVAV